MDTRRFIPPIVLTLAFVVSPWLAPLPSRPAADAFFDGDSARVLALARAVDRDIRRGTSSDRFATGSDRFDDEWAFGTTMTAAMGFGQAAILVPSHRAELLRSMERAIDAMLSPAGRAYDAEAWDEDPIEALDSDRDHAAYLGYGGLPLGLHRLLVPNSRFAPIHDRFVRALERRIAASPTGILETYPGERYGCDTAAAYGAIGLARRAGITNGVSLDRYLAHAIDRRTGLVVQAFDVEGRATDAPRGSGTALAAYSLRFFDPAIAHRLDHAMVRALETRVGDFGAMREYRRGQTGFGDIDSGPVVLGASVSATGFSLGSARSFRDRSRFRRLFATTWLFGAPTKIDSREAFVTGGPLGNALLFAMLTALPIGSLRGDAR